MIIKELSTLSESQVKDVLSLLRAVASTTSHFFTIIEDNDRIIGCATLCVFDSPTGRKASVEDVVVSSPSAAKALASC